MRALKLRESFAQLYDVAVRRERQREQQAAAAKLQDVQQASKAVESFEAEMQAFKNRQRQLAMLSLEVPPLRLTSA